ncbi:IPT/TIG domain-containing protein, partial [Streptomyces kronopolitis]|uniref:IPT/TIG domain-containing protein n=1 Tax=Streptomyces kronopolitis TaxID=1612435 RepID=UPI003424580F
AGAINPATGTTAGGTAVTVTGTNLTGASVTIGGVPATNVVVNAAGTSLTALTPPGAAGNAPVVITTPGGSATVPGGYTYTTTPPPPTTELLLPNAGSTAGGTPFTIIGTDLTGTTTVTFGGNPATNIVIDPAGTSLTGLTPPGSAGNVPVTVTTAGGSATLPGGYTYTTPVPPPTIASILPNSGPATGGTAFTLTGTNLTGATVTIRGQAASNIVIDPTGTSLTGLTPPGATGNADVAVTTPNGAATLPGGYTYTTPVPPPTIASILPNSGPTAGGTAFTLTGTNLTGATLTIGGAPATNVVVNPAGTSLTALTPPGTAGNADVSITTPGGTTNLPDGYTYGTPTQPTGHFIAPRFGTTIGGTVFTLTGTNLTGASVTIGGNPATGITTNDSGTSLTGTTPSGTAGNVPVAITTPHGTATINNGYTYINRNPLIYVAGGNAGFSNITIVDPVDNSTTDLNVGTYSANVAISPDATKVYIPRATGEVSGTVSVVNPVTNQWVKYIPVGMNPYGVAFSPDGTKAYVACANTYVYVIDTATDTVTKTIASGQSTGGVAFSPDGTKAYVGNYTGDTFSVINALTDEWVKSIPLTRAQGVAFSPDGTRAYVARPQVSTVTVIDTATDTPITDINVGTTPWNVAVTPDGSKVYATLATANGGVSVIDAATNKWLYYAGGSLSVPRGVAASTDGTKVYVAYGSSYPWRTLTLDTSTDNVIGSPVITQGFYGVAYG